MATVGLKDRARTVAPLGGALGLLALSIAGLFVSPHDRVEDTPPAPEATQLSTAARSPPGFPGLSGLPIETESLDLVRVHARLHMQRGSGDNQLYLEMEVPNLEAPARASTAATVLGFWPNAGGRMTVALKSANGFGIEYGNLSRVWVETGQRVVPGEVLGTVGPGVRGGSRLRYEVRTGQRYFATIRLEPFGPRRAGAMVIGPGNRVSVSPAGDTR